MKNLLRYFLALSTLALVLPSVNGNASAADTGIKRVVLIGVDGPRLEL